MNTNTILQWIMIAMIIIIVYKLYHESDILNLKCIISDVNGKRYCVRDRHKLHEAADKLATTADNMQILVDYVANKYPDRNNCIRLKENFDPKTIQETLPTSELTAYSENKGEKLAFCLNKTKDNKDGLIDNNTLMFVAIHELAHVATKSVGHTEEFWENFKFLLHNAEAINIYTPINYEKKPESYCGMDITHSPYYD